MLVDLQTGSRDPAQDLACIMSLYGELSVMQKNKKKIKISDRHQKKTPQFAQIIILVWERKMFNVHTVKKAPALVIYIPAVFYGIIKT